MMKFIKVKMLRDVRLNPTQKVGDFVNAKKGKVIEVAEHLVNDMIAHGACEEFIPEQKQNKKQKQKENKEEQKSIEEPLENKALDGMEKNK